MLFSLGMSNQCWMSAGQQLNSFVAVGANKEYIILMTIYKLQVYKKYNITIFTKQWL